MREIKFRAFENGIMYQQVRCGGLFNGVPTAPTTWIEEKGWVNLTGQPHTKVMQFTGLKDKNGVEIYEGDVLECKTFIGQYKAVVCFGEYNQDGSGDEYPPTKCIGFYTDKTKAIQTERNRHSFDDTTSIVDSEFSWIKVIGNIYENPELLKGASE